MLGARADNLLAAWRSSGVAHDSRLRHACLIFVLTPPQVVPSIAATRLLYEGLVAWQGIGGVRRYRAEDKGA